VKVLGLMGSPRIGGNTDILITEVLRGAELAGAETERIDLIRYDVSACTGCEDCRASGFCVINDDAPGLIDLMMGCDVWAIGTPIYWWGPSGILKAFIDRWYSTIHISSIRARMAKRVALVCTYGDEDPRTPRHVVGMMEDTVAYLRGDLTDRLLERASSLGAVRQDADAKIGRAHV
jgi:multimeric flavodoxin WrbA